MISKIIFAFLINLTSLLFGFEISLYSFYKCKVKAFCVRTQIFLNLFS